MLICRVIGTAVSTVKREEINGFKLLVVREVSLKNELGDRTLVAIDTVGAGEEELVMVTLGSAASHARPGNRLPVDAAIVGILDSLSSKGALTYDKQGAE